MSERVTTLLTVLVVIGSLVVVWVARVHSSGANPQPEATEPHQASEPQPDAVDDLSCQAGGIKLYYQGRFQEAVDALDLCAATGHVSDKFYFIRGKARLELKDYRGAHADFTAAVASNPENLRPLSQRALALYRIGEMREAMADIADVLGRSKEGYVRAEAFRVRGHIMLDEGQEKLALDDYRRAIHADPRYKYWIPMLGFDKMEKLGRIILLGLGVVLVFKLRLKPPEK